MSEREFLTIDQAKAMLAEGKNIHTFRQSGYALLGADWERSEIIKALESSDSIELSGQAATALGHGICIKDESGWLFIETREEAKEATNA